MKMITEYLEHALSFERMAGEEQDPNVSESSLNSRRRPIGNFAADRAERFGLPAPSAPDPSLP
jgi:hypothetical protein